jgi:hypothetical protein
MAANSASCKGWCIAITSAILVLVADKSKPDYALIALIPILLFLALDAYYLASVHSTDEQIFFWSKNCLRTLNELTNEEVEEAKRLFDELYHERKQT